MTEPPKEVKGLLYNYHHHPLSFLFDPSSSSLLTYLQSFPLTLVRYTHQNLSTPSLAFPPQQPPEATARSSQSPNVLTMTYNPSPLRFQTDLLHSPLPQHPGRSFSPDLTSFTQLSADPIHPYIYTNPSPDNDTAHNMSAGERWFVETFGEEIWDKYQDGEAMVVSDLSGGRKAGERMLQATVRLRMSRMIKEGGEMEVDDGTCGSFRVILDLICGPEFEDGDWLMESYSAIIMEEVRFGSLFCHHYLPLSDDAMR